MTVTADEVRWAYRLVLGREAESDEVVSHWQQTPDTRSLLLHFISSSEAQARARVPTIGRYMLAARPHLDVCADPATLARMLDRIRQAWSAFGEDQPFWSVITDPAYAADSIAAHKDRFYASAADELARIQAALDRAGIDPASLRRVLDYGCGVGRITLTLAQHFSDVTGIDISPGHIREAQARAAESGIGNATFRAIASVEELDDLPGWT